MLSETYWEWWPQKVDARQTDRETMRTSNSGSHSYTLTHSHTRREGESDTFMKDERNSRFCQLNKIVLVRIVAASLYCYSVIGISCVKAAATSTREIFFCFLHTNWSFSVIVKRHEIQTVMKSVGCINEDEDLRTRFKRISIKRRLTRWLNRLFDE